MGPVRWPVTQWAATTRSVTTRWWTQHATADAARNAPNSTRNAWPGPKVANCRQCSAWPVASLTRNNKLTKRQKDTHTDTQTQNSTFSVDYLSSAEALRWTGWPGISLFRYLSVTFNYVYLIDDDIV